MMKALLVLEDSQNTQPGDPVTRFAENALHSMGIKVIIYNMTSAIAAAPNDVATISQLCTDLGVSLLVIPRWTGTSRGRSDNITANIDQMSVPVFVLSCNTYLGTEGTNAAFYNGESAGFREAEIVSTGGAIYTNTRRYSLAAQTLPAVAAPIVRGTGADIEAVSTWKYSPDGLQYSYWTNSEEQNGHLHLMVQAAINDGVMEAPPKRAPIILNIDHINDGGDSPHDGGFQEQPGRLSLIGEILRARNGVCYANLEKNWITNAAGGLGQGTTDGELLANLIDYSDVFKYIACHDHNQFYTAANAVNAAVDDQTAKTLIDASYQATKTAIEGIGLTVNTDFAHCAGNRFGSNFLELAQPAVSYLSDPLNVTAKAGYGFKAVRVSGGWTANESWPCLSIAASNSVTGILHWMKQKTKVRGMVCIPNKDGGNANGAIDSLSSDFSAFQYNLNQLHTGIITYHHGADFEDASIRAGGNSTDGNAMTRGLLSWQTGANYAAACESTISFGADINDYT